MNKKTFIKLHSSGYLELLGTTTAKTDEMDKMERTVERTIKRAGGIGKLAASATSALRHSEVYGSEVEIISKLNHRGDSIGLTRKLPAKLASIQVVLEELTGNNIKLEIIRKEVRYE